MRRGGLRKRRRFLKLWHHFTCLDEAAHRFFPPRLFECEVIKKNYSEVSYMVQTPLTFLFGMFARKITLQPARWCVAGGVEKKSEVKPEKNRSKRGEFQLPRNTGSISEHLRYYVDYMHSPKLYTSHSHWVEGSKSSHAPTPDWLAPSLCKCKRRAHWPRRIRGSPRLAARSLCAEPTRRRWLGGKVETGQ